MPRAPAVPHNQVRKQVVLASPRPKGKAPASSGAAAETTEDVEEEVASYFHPLQPSQPQASASSSSPVPPRRRAASVLGQRTLSPSALVLSGKAGRTSAVPSVTPAAGRKEEPVGGTPTAVRSRGHGGSRPYSKWDLKRYEADEDEDSRRGFWQRAPPNLKMEVAQGITAKYRERDELYQQAKALGAEAFGLGGVPAVGKMEAEEGSGGAVGNEVGQSEVQSGAVEGFVTVLDDEEEIL